MSAHITHSNRQPAPAQSFLRQAKPNSSTPSRFLISRPPAGPHIRPSHSISSYHASPLFRRTTSAGRPKVISRAIEHGSSRDPFQFRDMPRRLQGVFSIFPPPFLFCTGFFEVTDSIPRSASIMGNCMIPSLFALHSQRYIAGHQGGLLVPLRFTRPRHLKFLELPGWEM